MPSKPVFCWAHDRRKFKDLRGKVSKHFFDQIDEFFRLDREVQKLPVEERWQAKQDRIRPAMERFFAEMEEYDLKTLSKSLREAVNYTLKLKDGLLRYLEDGRLSLSNNLAERAMKEVVIGRKNSLFSTSIAGADANFIFHSLVETAKRNGLDVAKYIRHVLETMPHPGIKPDEATLEACLPWNPDVQALCGK
jgi:hypothetical protein